MHVTTACEFSVSYPQHTKIKPIPGRRLSITHTREIVNSIVNSVDRFYKPMTLCRRHFNVFAPFMTKYYPDCITKIRKQASFLHTDQCASIVNNRRYQKSISLYEITSSKNLYSSCGLRNYCNIIKICNHFLTSERFLCNLQKCNLFDNNVKDTNISKYMYWLNLASINSIEVQKKRMGVGFKKSYRKSFPLISSIGIPVSHK